jgi:ABC-2 type transport system permease protein
MIHFNSIIAIVLRYFYVWKSDYNTMLAGLYWPLLDILIWGFLGSWIQQSNMGEFNNYQFVALLGILLWQVIGRGSNIMIGAFNEELWSNNIVNLFSLPLKITEYIIGIIFFYILMISFTTFFCILFIPILYNIALLHILSSFLIFAIPFLICGAWLGFMSLSVVVTLGKRGTELAYIISWFFLPFSGAYYPVSVLPIWAQKFSSYLPMSYLFQGVREHFLYQKDPVLNIIKGSCIGIIYLMIAIVLFIYCFNRSKKNGLSRLTE